MRHSDGPRFYERGRRCRATLVLFHLHAGGLMRALLLQAVASEPS